MNGKTETKDWKVVREGTNQIILTVPQNIRIESDQLTLEELFEVAFGDAH